jgi:cell fate (sporulation/competence/biofilm development) regulator YlbF (YheA/YmcA/DUF963 family)
MDTSAKDSALIERTRDLCQAIVDQPDFLALKARLDGFLGDEALKFQYQQINELGQILQTKQGQGIQLGEEEISQFEELRQDLLGNPTAQGFFEAQQQLQQLHQVVDKFLDKTFELGRRPDFEDVQDGSCGSGCGCH